MENAAVEEVSQRGWTWGFQAQTDPSPKQPDLTPDLLELALLWAGGWTRGLPRFLLGCDPQAFRHPKSC